jgi:hypothetical protein
MENENLDKITAGILANSGLEMTDPHLPARIMAEIKRKEKQRLVARYILFCSLIIIGTATAIFLLLQPGHSSSLIIPPGLEPFSSSIMFNITKAGNWLLGNLFFILPVIVLLLFKMLIDSKLKGFGTSRH